MHLKIGIMMASYNAAGISNPLAMILSTIIIYIGNQFYTYADGSVGYNKAHSGKLLAKACELGRDENTSGTSEHIHLLADVRSNIHTLTMIPIVIDVGRNQS